MLNVPLQLLNWTLGSPELRLQLFVERLSFLAGEVLLISAAFDLARGLLDVMGLDELILLTALS